MARGWRRHGALSALRTLRAASRVADASWKAASAAAARIVVTVVSITETGRTGDAARTSMAASRAMGRRSTGEMTTSRRSSSRGQGQQILDEQAHALGLALDAVHGLGDVVVALDGAHAVQLGVAAHRHERSAQLVAGIADEAAHLPHGRVALRDGAVHAVHHRVDRGLEPADLCARRLDARHALAEIARRDRHRGRLDLAEAAEGQSHQPAGEERARDDRDEGQDAVDAEVGRHDAIDRRDRHRDHLRVQSARTRRLEDVGARVEDATGRLRWGSRSG